MLNPKAAEAYLGLLQPGQKMGKEFSAIKRNQSGVFAMTSSSAHAQIRLQGAKMRTFYKTVNFFSHMHLGQCGYKYPEGLKPQDPEEKFHHKTQP